MLLVRLDCGVVLAFGLTWQPQTMDKPPITTVVYESGFYETSVIRICNYRLSLEMDNKIYLCAFANTKTFVYFLIEEPNVAYN